MKKAPILLSAFILLLASCNNSKNDVTPLNTTEQSIIGTWFLKKEHIIANPDTLHFDQTYENFPNNPYVTFKSERSPNAGTANVNANAKICIDKADIGEYGTGMIYRGDSTTKGVWYYDEQQKILHISYSPKLLISETSINVSGSNMIMVTHWPNDGLTDTMWFQK